MSKPYDRGRLDEQADTLAYLEEQASFAAAEQGSSPQVLLANARAAILKQMIVSIRNGQHVGTARLRITENDLPRHLLEEPLTGGPRTIGTCKVCNHPQVFGSDPCPGPPAAVALIRSSDWSSGKLLVVSRKEGGYGLPGGKREPTDSSMLDALRREVREEVGIDVGEAVEAYVAPSPRTKRTVHVFVVRDWQGALRAVEPGTEIDWLTPTELVSNSRFYGPFYATMFDAVGWSKLS